MSNHQIQAAIGDLYQHVKGIQGALIAAKKALDETRVLVMAHEHRIRALEPKTPDPMEGTKNQENGEEE